MPESPPRDGAVPLLAIGNQTLVPSMPLSRDAATQILDNALSPQVLNCVGVPLRD